MQHSEHVNLIKKANIPQGGRWADFGSGEGAFTLALRDLAGENVEIYSIDKDKEILEKQKKKFEIQFPHTNVYYVEKNFIENLDIPLLDGIIMANSLHYVQDQNGFLTTMQKYLK